MNITIPARNRAPRIEKAVSAALSQVYDNYGLTVVDDGSTDDTFDILKPYFDHPRLCYIRLAESVGAAQAKNLSLLCSRYDAITFHHVDEMPAEHKLLVQSRALCADGRVADDMLDWRSMGHDPDGEAARHTERRTRDREQVWYRTQVMRQATEREALKRQMCAMIDLSGVEIEFVSRPSLLRLNERVPATEWSKAAVTDALSAQVA